MASAVSSCGTGGSRVISSTLRPFAETRSRSLPPASATTRVPSVSRATAYGLGLTSPGIAGGPMTGSSGASAAAQAAEGSRTPYSTPPSGLLSTSKARMSADLPPRRELRVATGEPPSSGGADWA